jgi:hypothetical protein
MLLLFNLSRNAHVALHFIGATAGAWVASQRHEPNGLGCSNYPASLLFGSVMGLVVTQFSPLVLPVVCGGLLHSGTTMFDKHLAL